MAIANEIKKSITCSSWIRKMFDEGNKLKKKHGIDKVFDFSLGNPILPPPEAFYNSLESVIECINAKGHSYMPQTGYPETCHSVAKYITKEQGISISGNEIIMTCGAAGALNIALKSILNPGDEVVIPSPCFVEYRSYVSNHSGVPKMVSTKHDFDLDFKVLDRNIKKKTKAIIINSPNNPTGKVYSEETIGKLGRLLVEKSKKYNHSIYLISDEPYRKIVYDGIVVPSIFKNYSESIVVTSYSKDLSIPGERIGFASVSPTSEHKEELVMALALANRILGFVNAPSLMQHVVAQLQGASVNISEYKRKRDILCKGLLDIGYKIDIPQGAFYLFPRSPAKNDIDFVKALQEELILVVPGSGFEGPGFFRIAFCVSDKTILGAMPGFKKVFDIFKQ